MAKSQRVKVVEYTVEPATREDAKGIARCFRKTYGGTYPWPQFFEENSAWALMSAPGVHTWVLKDDKQEVMGTGSVLLDDTGQKAELGRTVIDPDFRGVRNKAWLPAYGALTHARIGFARETAQLVYTAAVTFHAGSQKGLLQAGFVPVGFQLVKYPDISNAGQRESTVLMVHRVTNWSDEPEQVYVPNDTIAAVVKKTVDEFELGRELNQVSDEGGVELKRKGFDPEVSRHATYQIKPGYQRIEDALGDVEFQAGQRNLLYVEVEVAANMPQAPLVYKALRKAGFAFGGFLPEWIRNGEKPQDAFLLQRNKVPEASLDKVLVIPHTAPMRDYVLLKD